MIPGHCQINQPKRAKSANASLTFMPVPSRRLQRKCACGGLTDNEGECVECREKAEADLQRKSADGLGADVGHDFGRVNVTAPSRLNVTQPGDAFEQEADRVADAVMAGRAPLVATAASGPAVQRDDASPTGPATEKPKSDADKLKDALPKVIEALRARDDVKQLEARIKQMGADFVSTTEGKAVVGTTLAGALAAIIATNKELPMQVPEIPLDWLSPGLKAELTWKGPVRSPTDIGLKVTLGSGVSLGASYSDTAASPGKPAGQKAGLTLTIPLGGSATKTKGPSKSDRIQADITRLRAEKQKQDEASKTPQDRAEEQQRLDNYVLSKANELVDPLGSLKRKKRDDSLLLMRKAQNVAGPQSAPPVVDAVLAESGAPLDTATRGFMEARFGHDFSRVRVHTDARAAESAHAIHAAAYTVGNHLVFAAGAFQPSTTAGQRLLAHELVHTIQQGATPRADTPQAVSAVAPQVQRYAVPAELPCNQLVGWMSSNSPYAPEWAETNCDYTFNGQVNVKTTPQADGSVKADVRGHPRLSVSVNCPIDRPEWDPSDRPNRDAEVAAWRAMRTILDQHEAAHRRIGQTWRTTLEGRFRAVNFSVTGTDHDDALANATAELESRKNNWGADAQAAQSAIDPFRGARLTCPPTPTPTSP
jgi:hypothetical protein